MDHFVTLEKLPDDFAVPPKFGSRLEYNAEAHKLVFHGYMSKAEFDQLSAISKDWRFRRTLEDLFRQCTPETKPPPSGFVRVLANFGQLFSKR